MSNWWRRIGAGRPDIAVSRARIALGLAVGYMSVCALGFLVFRDSLIGVFVGGDTSLETRTAIVSIGATMLVWAALFQTMDAVGIVYSGALRGAGDTVWPGLVSSILGWLLLVGLGWLMVEAAPGLSSVGPWIGATAYILAFGIVMAVRFERQGWRRISLVTEGGVTGPHLPAGPAAPALDGASAYRDLAEDVVHSTRTGVSDAVREVEDRSRGE